MQTLHGASINNWKVGNKIDLKNTYYYSSI